MPLIATERSKCYREAHKEVQKKDNLRKKFKRELMKLLSPKVNVLYLLSGFGLENQIIAKALYRKKKIEEAQ